MVGGKINYPFPEKYVVEYSTKLFDALRRGDCITTVWVAMAGRRVVTNFVLNNIHLFEKYFPEHRKFMLVYIEPLDLTEETQAGYLKLICRSILEACRHNPNLSCNFLQADLDAVNGEQSSYPKILEIVKTWISNIISQGIDVSLFLGEFDELNFVNSIFCNNLRSLWNKFDSRLHYVFLIKDTRLIFDKNHFGEELGYLFFQNVVYIPVSKDNENYLLEYFSKKTGYELDETEKETVAEFCDGHPYFLKLAMENLAKNKDENPYTREKIKNIFKANYEMRAASEMMLGVLASPMRKILEDIAAKEIYKLPDDEEAQALVDLGIIKKGSEGYYQIFCKTFRDAVLKKTLPNISPDVKQRKIYWDDTINSIVANGSPVDEKLTRQEYEILAYFLKNPNVVHSRDDIAEALWGKDSLEKYSDWAIDQLMSKIRKKLGEIGLPEKNLVTVRGRGYKFVN